MDFTWDDLNFILSRSRPAAGKSKSSSCRKERGKDGGVRLSYSFQLLPHRNLKVHQFGAFGIVNAAHVDARTSQRRGNVCHVEEEES
jgi:hypothetical protein